MKILKIVAEIDGKEVEFEAKCRDKDIFYCEQCNNELCLKRAASNFCALNELIRKAD